MGSQCETGSWIHRLILPHPIPFMTTFASGGALQGREELALSSSLPLLLALSHITHSCSVPEKHHVCYGFSPAYGCSYVSLCTVITNKWLLTVVFMSVSFANKWCISNNIFPAKIYKPANCLGHGSQKVTFYEKKKEKKID